MTAHTRAALQALFVTLLWSTSWVLIKLGLDDIPALTFAGLRYVLAFLCLLPLAWRSGQLGALRRLPRADGRRLAVLGLLYYTVTQGAQFLGLRLQRDLHENRGRLAQPPRIDQRHIAGDEPLVLQPLHPPVAGRRRQVHPF